MRIIILGYNGLIGRSILENLNKYDSLDLICVGRNIKDKPYTNSRVRYFKWTIINFKKTHLLFLQKADVIINCVGKNDDNTLELKYINIIFVKKLLRHINNLKSKVRFIHMSSVAVYGGAKKYFGQSKLINENSNTKVNDLYSKSKLKSDLLIQNKVKKNLKKNFSYTILRISNVFGEKKKSNLFRFFLTSLKFSFWIKSFNDIRFNFVNVKDVAQAVILTIFKLNVSKNKIYIVSDDCKQKSLYDAYQKFHKKKIVRIQIPFNFIKFLIYFFPIPKKLFNLFLIISSRISYSNTRIKNELNYIPRFSMSKKIRTLK
jgi:nucleoside-diphosphate-sugar epimerase